MALRPADTIPSRATGGAARRGAHAPELPAEHALLGLLKLAGGTAHGYELGREFRRGQPLGDVLHLEQAMLYKHLKKLARLGWLTMSLQDQAPRPPRQVCHLTPAGEAELKRWLAAPVARTREIRLEFLVKLYFAWQLEPELARRLVDHQRNAATRTAASLSRQLHAARAEGAETLPDAGQPRAFHELVLELRLEQTRAAASWLERVAHEIGAPPSLEGDQP